MDKALLKKYKEFFTIEKMEFNYFTQKNQNKKHRLYTKDCLPPMYKEILNLDREPYKFGQAIGFKQKPVPAEVKKKFAENIEFQDEILRVIKKRIEDFNYKCGIIKAKTGMGKSHIVMDIIEYLQTTTLILVSNKKLMQEMVDKFSAMTNCIPAQYGDGKKDLGFITVMTKKSFGMCEMELLQDFDTIIIDELQSGFTKDFRETFNTTFKDKEIFLYGLSATPYTADLDEGDMQKYYGKMIEIKKAYDFIPSFTFYNYVNITQYEFEHYAELKQALIDDPDRTKHQQEVLLNNLSPVCSLILSDRLEDIDNWEQFLFENSFLGYEVVKITGQTKIKDDKAGLDKALASGKQIVIIGSTAKCATGFDFPIIDTVFLFSSIKFESTVIQSVGRALRKAKNKTGANIYVWNDKVLDKQRVQKQMAIKEEYGVSKDQIKIIEINKTRKKKGTISLII